MAEKNSKWTFGGNTLSLGDKTQAVRTSLNLTEAFPGFDQMPEYQRFALVYGTKQMIGDNASAIPGAKKVDFMIADLTVEWLQKKTFAGDGRKGGITFLAKTQNNLAEGMEKNLKEKEQEMLRTLMIKAGMGNLLKVKE